MTILSQLNVFGLSLIFGTFLSIIFDLFRIVDIISNAAIKQLFFEDVLYFFIVGILSFLFMLIVNKGNFGIFIVLGELIGFTLWHFSLGKLFVKFSKQIIIYTKNKISLLKDKLLKPMDKFYSKLKSFLKINSSKIKSKLKKIT